MPIKKRKIVEKVVAFEGEQDFIINPNKPDYISAGEVLYVAADAVGDSPTGGGITPNGGGAVIPPETVQYIIPDWDGMDCSSLNSAIASLTSFISGNRSKLDAENIAYYESELTKAKTIYRTKCTNVGDLTPDSPATPPTYNVPNFSTMSCDTLKTELDKLKSWFSANQGKLGISGIQDYGSAIKEGNDLYAAKCQAPQYPKFDIPTWSSLSCDQLASKIKELENYLKEHRSKMIGNDVIMYDAALSNGISIQSSKCKSTTVTTTTQIIPPPRFFGGGGGGFGAAPEEPTPLPEKKKGGINWLLLLLIAGGIYLATKKKQ